MTEDDEGVSAGRLTCNAEGVGGCAQVGEGGNELAAACPPGSIQIDARVKVGGEVIDLEGEGPVARASVDQEGVDIALADNS